MNHLPAPIQRVFDLFSSVRFGITLLVLLLIYSWIGSAGILYPTSLRFFDLDNWDQIVVRHHRWFELTEYEWFHWWPFNLLIALICVTLVTTTLRRIPFRPVNYGVWTIHTGIIILALGSVWYFSTKFEGDIPVARRNVVITLPGAEPQSMVASVGNRLTVRSGDSQYTCTVSNVDPNWELLTGDDAGKKTYAVSVMVRGPERTFIRQLLAGYPQYTEDVIPGEGRAIKTTGNALVDETISIELDYDPQEYFYLTNTDALYLREVGEREWIERPIHNLPRYNDYIANADEVWPISRAAPVLDPLSIGVPAVSADDPLHGTDLTIGSYLRYAEEQERRVAGGSELAPYLKARLLSDRARTPALELLALDPMRNRFADGFATFHWVNNETEREAVLDEVRGSLTIEVPEREWSSEVNVADVEIGAEAPFREVEGTDYAWRIIETRDRFEADSAGQFLSVAVIDISTPEQTIRRWVFDRPALTRDNLVNAETGDVTEIPLDAGIVMRYRPGSILTFIAGPEEIALTLTVNSGAGPLDTREVRAGETIQLGETLALAIDAYAARSRIISKPVIALPSQRDREADQAGVFRMIRVEFPGPPGEARVSYWLPFHAYAVESTTDAALPSFHQPKRVLLSDGREIEMIYARQRQRLPAPVVLERFDVTYHVGGFSGDNLSVDNWESIIRFAGDRGLSDPRIVSINAPAEYRGVWFFQKAWDPPTTGRDGRPPTPGLNYTVLGIANRNGVYVQLLGCCFAVMGMIYAFYVKPIIKRRIQLAVYEQVGAGGARGQAPEAPDRPREVLGVN